MMIEDHAPVGPDTFSRPPEIATPPVADRYEVGRKLRRLSPRAAHAEWQPPRERDILALRAASNKIVSKSQQANSAKANPIVPSPNELSQVLRQTL
jgi:hypothetical protein